MNDYKRLFEEAERLKPPPGLWRRIESQVGMRSGAGPEGAGFLGSPALRAAAAVVLAVGLLGLGLMLRQRPDQVEVAVSSLPAVQAAEETGTELVDPELLGWHADLGEVEEESDAADEAGEVL
ncbi:MAG: hypothetical protein JWP91_1830 [Fibrobacteres bacterium]|nr:hypothetical protein [Fibrobacterota bacterium]